MSSELGIGVFDLLMTLQGMNLQCILLAAGQVFYFVGFLACHSAQMIQSHSPPKFKERFVVKKLRMLHGHINSHSHGPSGYFQAVNG